MRGKFDGERAIAIIRFECDGRSAIWRTCPWELHKEPGIERSRVMKAISQSEYGGPEVLQFVDVPTPTLEPHDLLVRVQACAVNPVDAKRRRAGPTPLPFPKILGFDGAGIVEQAGSAATLFHAGDEVYFAGDATRQGCYAEFVAIDERIVGHKPKALDFIRSRCDAPHRVNCLGGLLRTDAPGRKADGKSRHPPHVRRRRRGRLHRNSNCQARGWTARDRDRESPGVRRILSPDGSR